ncbi:unnamed protein product, partial [Scytosiphon promiscuus]
RARTFDGRKVRCTSMCSLLLSLSLLSMTVVAVVIGVVVALLSIWCCSRPSSSVVVVRCFARRREPLPCVPGGTMRSVLPGSTAMCFRIDDAMELDQLAQGFFRKRQSPVVLSFDSFPFIPDEFASPRCGHGV